MSLTVLTDDEIRRILEDLSIDEWADFRIALAETLHEYSNNAQAVADGTYIQPERISTYSPKTGAATLYMPSCSPLGMGCKVITLSARQAPDIILPAIQPTGAITLLRPDGQPVGFLHAKTLTAFRTALSSSCLVAKRATVKTLTVFGTGLQAYWHVRLALLVRGSTIKHVHFINRRFSENAKHILKKFYAVSAAIKQREGWAEAAFDILTPGYTEYDRLMHENIRSADVLFCCTPSTETLFDHAILTSHEGRKKGRLIIAVGSYTPQMRELPEELLIQVTKQEKQHRHYHKHAHAGGVIVVDTLDGALKEAGEIIGAGIKATQLVELGELIMLHRIRQGEEEEEAAAAEAAAELEKLELNTGTSSMSSVYGGSDTTSSEARNSLSRETSATTASSNSGKHSFHLLPRSSSHSSLDREKKKKEDSLALWLRDGTVIYKSVGLGLMDLAVGMHMIKVAAARGVGTHIEGF